MKLKVYYFPIAHVIEGGLGIGKCESVEYYCEKDALTVK